MIRWTVEGADAQTGKERVISIEAPTEQDATRDARAQGILVSSVHRSTTDPPPALDYRNPKTRPPASPTTPYEDILTGAKWLRLYSSLLNGFGIVAFVSAVLALVVIAMATASGHTGDAAGAGSFALASGLSGVVMLASAAVVRMAGSLAIAVRNIALDVRRMSNDPPRS